MRRTIFTTLHSGEFRASCIPEENAECEKMRTSHTYYSQFPGPTCWGFIKNAPMSAPLRSTRAYGTCHIRSRHLLPAHVRIRGTNVPYPTIPYLRTIAFRRPGARDQPGALLRAPTTHDVDRAARRPSWLQLDFVFLAGLFRVACAAWQRDKYLL